MGGGWNIFRFQFLMFTILIVFFGIQRCWSLNSEGLALLEFRTGVESDPYGAFSNWNSSDSDACMWLGVHCVDTEVQKLDLSGLSLEGILAPGLGKLTHLRSLVLQKNNFSGTIPKEIGGLIKLELLDLRDNNLSGPIPEEIAIMPSLQHLLLCDNSFDGMFPIDAGKLKLLAEFQFDKNPTSPIASEIDSMQRKFGHWSNFRRDSSRGQGDPCCRTQLSVSSKLHKVSNIEDEGNFVRRRLLQQSSNLAAIPASGGLPLELVITPYTQSSGAFPAIDKKQFDAPVAQPLPAPSNQTNNTLDSHDQASQLGPSGNSTNPKTSVDGSSGSTWKYLLVVPGVALLLIVAAIILCMCRRKGVKTIGPWTTGLSGQLQKAFVTGVAKLNLTELETACEDFSNIIDTGHGRIVYKGTLSSKVEIAVVSTAITCSKDWPKRAETAFWKEIDKLSRVNHKNFVNLLGYCKEDDIFKRMMVFEYAPNGSLFEHLHVKEMDPLDWKTRTRIIMGTAYCLQHMHELNPPIPQSNLASSLIFLTNCCAAKISNISFGLEKPDSKIEGKEGSEHSELPPIADIESNVFDFGILLLEIVTGKLPYSDKEGSLANWAAEHLQDKQTISDHVDPTITSFEKKELDVICEVIQDCIQPDPRQRPTMKEVTSKLREVIRISPETAAPSLTTLWWTALELHRSESAEFV